MGQRHLCAPAETRAIDKAQLVPFNDKGELRDGARRQVGGKGLAERCRQMLAAPVPSEVELARGPPRWLLYSPAARPRQD